MARRSLRERPCVCMNSLYTQSTVYSSTISAEVDSVKFSSIEPHRIDHISLLQLGFYYICREYIYHRTSNMKSVSPACVERPVDIGLGIRHDSSFKITRPRIDDMTAEMQACFLKLKELVPTIPQNKKLSRVQLLQHVIDYILDLEVALEPEESNLFSTASIQGTVPRSPLAEKVEPNTLVTSSSESYSEAASDLTVCDTRLAPK